MRSTRSISLRRTPATRSGPFVNVYLVTDRHWSQTEVGLVATTSGLLGIALQTPIGAAIDLTPAKRAVIVISISAMAFASLIIFGLPTFWPMAVAFGVLAIAGDAFAPAVAALTLGVTPKSGLARRLGRNSAFDHAGNIAIAIVAGAIGYVLSQRAVFLMVPVFAILTDGGCAQHPRKRHQSGARERCGRRRQSWCGPIVGAPVMASSSGQGRLSFSRSAPSFSISPMRRFCRSSDKSSRFSSRRRRPR